jgi:hypothetical protein
MPESIIEVCHPSGGVKRVELFTASPHVCAIWPGGTGDYNFTRDGRLLARVGHLPDGVHTLDAETGRVGISGWYASVDVLPRLRQLEMNELVVITHSAGLEAKVRVVDIDRARELVSVLAEDVPTKEIDTGWSVSALYKEQFREAWGSVRTERQTA